MKNVSATLLFMILSTLLCAQTDVKMSNALIDEILQGNYDRADYRPESYLQDPMEISRYLRDAIEPDSLREYILELARFDNRNTGSDTLSATRGIGAARSWILEKYDAFSRKADNRLITGYLEFDEMICGMAHHKNVVAVLPGTSDENHIVILEAHMDSRCEDPCDPDCVAQGVEDNASGTALVMELARVMSDMAFPYTIIFMCTTGEEQGLLGAEAMARYIESNDLPLRAVLNNDIVGGIICGATSSAPSCPGENTIDSTQVRLFSSGSTSTSKQLARYNKLQYEELLIDQVRVPMLLSIMSGEDRVGRGGDHIPFRRAGYPSMRFTSANEHGNANPVAGYMDRQHSHRDQPGIDTDGDGLVDSFFVDFNYLARNAVINATAAAMIAKAPETPDFEVFRTTGADLLVIIHDERDYGSYRVSARMGTTEWDTLIATSDTSLILQFDEPGLRFVSVCAVDSQGTESLFTSEEFARTTSTSGLTQVADRIELMNNRPNPYDEATYMTVWVKEPISYERAQLRVFDRLGKPIRTVDIDLELGMNDYLFEHGYQLSGTFYYGLWIDGERVDVKSMIALPGQR